MHPNKARDGLIDHRLHRLICTRMVGITHYLHREKEKGYAYHFGSRCAVERAWHHKLDDASFHLGQEPIHTGILYLHLDWVSTFLIMLNCEGTKEHPPISGEECLYSASENKNGASKAQLNSRLAPKEQLDIDIRSGAYLPGSSSSRKLGSSPLCAYGT